MTTRARYRVRPAHVLSRLSHRTRIVLLGVAVLVALVVALVLVSRRHAPDVRVTHRMVSGASGVRLDTTWHTPVRATRRHAASAVLVAHGLGDSQDDQSGLVDALTADGYVVVTWSSRGTGRSTGTVDVAGPGEVADVSALVDELARRSNVQHDGTNDPRVAVVGTSRGGGVALLAAAHDPRIDALVPIFAWSDLPSALAPDGVVKLRWGSDLFATAAGEHSAGACGALDTDLCRAWNESASRGALTTEAVRLLRARSPLVYGRQIHAPTMFVQGQMDSLFDLSQVTRLTSAMRRNRVALRVDWVRAGHDAPLDARGRDHLHEAVRRWLRVQLRGDSSVDAGPAFGIELGAGRGWAWDNHIPPHSRDEALPLRPVHGRAHAQRVYYPPQGLPARSSTLPGLGDVSGVPGINDAVPNRELARFRTKDVPRGTELIGTPSVRLRIVSHGLRAVYAHLADVSPTGVRIQPRGLVSAVALVPDGVARTYRVSLPPTAWRLAPSHHVELVVSSTDAAWYASPAAGDAVISLADGGDGVLNLPRVRTPRRLATTFDAGVDWRTLAWGATAIPLVAGLVLLGGWRRRHLRRRAAQEPGARLVPLRVTDLGKSWPGERTAVRGVSFEVPAGAVVGLVGPNGAGKTTIMRMILGLVAPTTGRSHIFGQLVRPGAPHLRRVGSLVDGPAVVPHLSGRANLARYARDAGLNVSNTHLTEVLELVALSADAHRPVRTWSQGMTQRLGIAQALLAHPELIVLDEPANGLDPVQIGMLRDTVRRLAADGCGVLVSSHLLGELEQVCTHVVLLTDGGVLCQGPLADVVGRDVDLEHAFLRLLTQEQRT